MNNDVMRHNRTRLLRTPVLLPLLAVLVIALSGLMLLRSPAAAADPADVAVRFEAGRADWSIAQYPAKVLRNNTFTLTLTDKSGIPLTGATLHVKLEMIGMMCGDYDFELAETSPGTYTGEGVPLMAGLWKATATISGSGSSNGAGLPDFAITRTLKAVH